MPEEKEQLDKPENIQADSDAGKRLDNRYWSQKKSSENRVGKGWLPFLAVMIAVFYIFAPLLAGSRFASFTTGVFAPACCIGCAVVFGTVYGFRWYYFIVTMLVFTPSVFINHSRLELKLIFLYGMISLMGNLLGSAFHREKY